MSSESSDLLRNEPVSHSSGPACRLSGTVVCLTVLGVLVVGLGVLAALAAGPLHAQCAVQWNISVPCLDVSALLLNQINEWTTETCPRNSQRCLYSLVSVNGEDIVATHTTPLLRFVDDITFNLSSPNTDNCVIQGHSVSRSWYAMLDSGTNYLNMHNLMRGSGLASSPSFTELTSDKTCTQYSFIKQKLDP